MPSTDRQTLAYLQLKSEYAKAAQKEGGLDAIAKVIEHKHRRTGKPYPCWNALKPYNGRNMPVSLSVGPMDNGTSKELFALMKVDGSKFDAVGRDGKFTSSKPETKSGFDVWRLDKRQRSMSKGRISKDVIALVDVSGSMRAKKKLKTLRGLSESNVQFKKILTFSDGNTLKALDKKDLVSLRPEGFTAVYDNLNAAMKEYPNDEIVVITDGRDNRSLTKFNDLLAGVGRNGRKVNVVLTGGNARRNFFDVANISKGEMLSDLEEKGEILEPYLEVVPE